MGPYFDEWENAYEELCVEESSPDEDENLEQEIGFWGYRERWPGKI